MFVHADACCKFIVVRVLEYCSVLVCDYCICFVGLFVIIIFSLMTIVSVGILNSHNNYY